MFSKPVPISSIAALLISCGPADTKPPDARGELSLVGSDTFLYFECNATGSTPSAANRLQSTEQPGVFSLSYDVTQSSMLRDGGRGDTCIFEETNELDGPGTFQRYYRSKTVNVPSEGALHKGTSKAQPFRVTYPELGRFELRLDWTSRRFTIEKASSPAVCSIGSDLSVQYLTHEPRFPLTIIDYDPPAYNPRLSAEAEAQKKWPDPGELVTYTAHVENQGDAPTPATGYRWLIDGAEVSSGQLPALAPGEAAEPQMPWAWQDGDHTVRFELTSDECPVFDDGHVVNNVREQRTNAVLFTIYTWPGFETWMAEHDNAVGTRSAADWVQFEADEMNRLFSLSTSDVAPDGVLLRIGIDRIVRVPEETPYSGGHVPPEPCPTDSCWAFGGPAQGLLDWLVAVDGQRDQVTMHEWGHQIGLLDVYNMDVQDFEVLIGPAPLAGTPLMPYVAADVVHYNSTYPNDLMGGGIPYVLSPFHQWALNLYTNWEGRGLPLRRGWFGQYIANVPASNALTIVQGGVPLAGALVEVFQQQDNIVNDLVKYSGTTDANGRFEFPKETTAEYAAFYGLSAPLATPTPFSTIYSKDPNVLGTNSVLVLRITDGGGQVSYRFLDVIQFNLEYARGDIDQGSYVIDVGTAP